jgi:LuxR family transcriptional regulator, maltose regulon positive regulatory protein
VIELRSADLRFTTNEAAQFLNDVMGLHLDASSIAALEERTEGWIAGLQLAALSMRDRRDVRGFIEGFSGTNRFILEYLLEEILSRQSAEIQHFLLRTSILERLTAPLCDALLKDDTGTEFRDEVTSRTWPVSDSVSIMRYLERENLFLVSLDDQQIWFRYHHLFADLLRARLNQTQPSMEHSLHIRAATWLEQNGFIPQAIQHLISAHEMGQAAELIERYVAIRWAESDPSIVLMAESLPFELLIARPKMAFYYAWYLIIQGSVEKAIPLLQDIEEQLVLADHNSGERWIQTLVKLAQAFLASRTNSSDLLPLPDYQMLDEIPPDEFILRDAADILYGMALGRRGQIEPAAELASKRIQQGKTHQRALAIPPLVPLLARIHLMQGRLHAVAFLCREYLDPLQEKGIRFIYSAGGMNIFLGEVLYEWNCLEEAESHVRDGLHANEPWVDIMTDVWGLLALTRILRAEGDYAAALQYVDKFERRLQGHLRPREFDEDFYTLRIRVELASGNLAETIKWAEQIRQSEDFRFHKERYQLVLSRIYLAQGKYRDAEEILKPMPSRPTSGQQITRQIEYNLLLAAAIAEEQRLPKALGLVESSLALAEPEGYIQIFLDVGEPARKLLKAYLRSAAPVHRLYAQKLLYTFSPADEASSPHHTQNELLSQRELEVLQLLALGKTNQEISEQLIVARGTIKAHAASIYRKLDATNRTEAVARARLLGILS